MTTLRKLPTIAPMAKAKTLSRLKAESYAIAGTRGNVTTRAYFDGGEWGLVASAVFKTVVSARKRRRVGSIPTRLRQAARPPAFVGKAFFGSAACRALLGGRFSEEPHLHRPSLVRRVHRHHGSIERLRILGVDEDHLVRVGPAAHLRADQVGQLLRRAHLLRVKVHPVGLDRDDELILLRRRRRSRHLHLR